MTSYIIPAVIIIGGLYALAMLFALGLGYGAKMGDEAMHDAYTSLRDGGENG
jgi:hypothetical protein